MQEQNLNPPATNEHIGKMAALPPLENMCGIANLSPAGKCSVAATSPICQNVGCNAGLCNKKKKRENKR
jgi:hypothetical protein